MDDDVIVVEYSEDMWRYAQVLGGSLAGKRRVVFRMVAGREVLRFRVNGFVFDWRDYDLMVVHELGDRGA
ncbi:MAG: hypothetical protein GSR84_04820 [Desulfurococcales archaeon]|nr:hypothetical protein [Desulfurococcales archaeon]